ncbi:DNA topoisomerase VI subunit B [Halosegnis rubeus]|jgi:DNA topoisomerase-6 subunit B|uniref:Type 2 DNA topoisomerase 6 subunit B n=1 Tax=Halosegnis rubeus TaxID=2212850 RepID=A0A5N5U3I7_9EURY|nr:ATP-binding protein [Halosegnis rubeus]KAB7513018.1 DNA topoisomerase VI subunit B [Halosegnis rubeus]KAB7513124.1 DNA topoisomerase VI subunit B [Halosegnis rubeus]KAB7516614.1 DNA topoisomerase VI subunit B [Halosegnis rubeus]
MTAKQSTLDTGGGETVADELAESQRSISIAEFFEKNKQMLGFDSGGKALVTAVKEAVDNALDATEEAGILPDIYVSIEEAGDYYRLVVEDNGPGITKEQVPKVFGKLLYGSRFHAREQSLTPDQRILVRRDGSVEFIPIGVLCDAYLTADGGGTAPIPDDIEAPCFDRESHELTWEPVTHAIRHRTDEQTYEVTTERGRSVEVTGNHSLFGVSPTGETTELKAGELTPGDAVLTPRQLPRPAETVDSVNLLEHIHPEQLDERRIYVYGFETETLSQLRSEETVRRKPSPESDRRRTYYVHDGVEILRDSFEQNYIQKGYLPAETVRELGWEAKASDCELKTYRIGGEATTVPVTVPLNEQFLQLLGYYISEGHAGARQIGLTFGSHETELIQRTEHTIETVSGSATTVAHERNSTRVKGFGSPLALFLQNVCGDSAATKRVPGFVFEMDETRQQQFIAALYEGDGSDAYPGNELSHTTTSQTLARQLSTLWSMQGVVASSDAVENPDGYAGERGKTAYRTKVYGEDVRLADVFETDTETNSQQYKRIPTSLLDEVRVGESPTNRVPDTIPGLLLAAGVGSGLGHAAVYQSLIEDALDGEYVEKPRYVHNLIEWELLDDNHQPTATLRRLWETIQELQGLTETDMCLLEVTAVEETTPPEYVYDISVPGPNGTDENFVVVNEGPLAVKNSRGQQGIGISAAVLYSQLTSGKPARITSKTGSGQTAQQFELTIDTDSNEPDVELAEETTWERPHGTRIELEMEANMRARTQLHDYIKYTAVVNPHARLEFTEPKAHEKYERATDQLPAKTKEIRPHPHGVELGTLLKMLAATESYSLSGFMQEEFTRVGTKTATSVLDAFRDRHFGREMTWRPPSATEEADVAAEVREATSNKGAEATEAFATTIAETIRERDRIAYHEIVSVVADAADEAGETFSKTFGEAVRENAVAAAWYACTRERTANLYPIVDGATTKRKDDAAVEGLARRLAEKFADADDTRDRASYAVLEEYVGRAADMTEEHDDETFGETARENVVDAVWETMVTVPDDPPKVSAVVEDRDAAAQFLEAMRETDILSPPTDCLAPITAELVEKGLRKEYDADFYAAATRDAEVHRGDPFVVEAGIAYGGDVPAEGNAEVLRFANRVPLVYRLGACSTTGVVKRINWRNYGLDQPGGSGMPNGPAVIMIHVASTNVPFTSESKDAVANVPEIEDEIELALREAARELKSHLNEQRSLEKRRRKQNVLVDILPEMARKLSEVTGREPLNIDDSLARIMNNVLVERTVTEEAVELTVQNHGSSSAAFELTDIVSEDPGDVDDATVVEMDGEWFVKWSVDVAGGEETSITYQVSHDAAFDISIEGVETEKVTVNA